MPKKPEEENLLKWLFEMFSLYHTKNDVREDEWSAHRERREAAGREFNRKLSQKFGPYVALVIAFVLAIGIVLVKGCATGS